jgi:hypothetical protein
VSDEQAPSDEALSAAFALIARLERSIAELRRDPAGNADQVAALEQALASVRSGLNGSEAAGGVSK